MKKKSRIRSNIYLRLMVIDLLLAISLRFCVPIFANYPPFSEEHDFHSQIEAFSHNQQYMFFYLTCIVLNIIFINIIFRKVFKYLKKDKEKVSKKEAEEVRKECFKVIPRITIVKIMMLAMLLMVVYFSMTLSTGLFVKLICIYLSFFLSSSMVFTLVIKSDLEKIILSTYEIEPKVHLDVKKGTFSSNLMFNLLPFLFVMIIILSLVGYARSCQEKGVAGYYYYRQYVEAIEYESKTIDEVFEELKTIELMEDSNYGFIIYEDQELYTNQEGKSTEFFKKYMEYYIEKTEGHIYEFFGSDEDAYAKKIEIDGIENVYIGIKYATTDVPTILYFMWSAIISIVLYTLLMIVWTKNIGKNIIDISENLKAIATGKTSGDSDLLVLTNDELGELTDSFNRIQKLTKNHIEQIQSNQELLMEKERLASLRTINWRYCP